MSTGQAAPKGDHVENPQQAGGVALGETEAWTEAGGMRHRVPAGSHQPLSPLEHKV